MESHQKKRACIIGARKGSKRFPGKNRKLIGGQPLYMNAVNAAKNSSLFNTIVVTTDDDIIINQLNKDDYLIIDKRPDRLADDESSMWDVGRYILKKYNKAMEGIQVLCFITPCHPFRTSAHLKEACDLFDDKNATTLISVSPFSCPPELAVDVCDQVVTRNWSGLVRKGDYAAKYHPNGAISLFDRTHFQNGGSIFSNHTIAYEIKWPYSLDIDYEEDYILAVKLFNITGMAGA